MEYQRLLNKTSIPNEKFIIDNIGKNSSLWIELQKYLSDNYDFTRETIFYGKKYGWTIRYRKSGKTLCSLFPEVGAFTILIVLGKKEVEKVYSEIDKLNPEVKDVFEKTEQLHDGKWLWIRVLNEDDLESIRLLLNTKRKPKR